MAGVRGAGPACFQRLGVPGGQAKAPDGGTLKRIRWIGGGLSAHRSRGGVRKEWTAHKLGPRTQAAGQPRSRCFPGPRRPRPVLLAFSNTPPCFPAQHGPRGKERLRRFRRKPHRCSSGSPPADGMAPRPTRHEPAWFVGNGRRTEARQGAIRIFYFSGGYSLRRPAPPERHTARPDAPLMRDLVERSARATARGGGGYRGHRDQHACPAACRGRTFARDARRVDVWAGRGRARRERCLPQKPRYLP
jgi:hypothetical protein